MNLSETIKDLCRELNITYSELARRSEQSAQNLSKKLNKNTLSFEEFERLLKLLNVEMDCGFSLPGGEPSNKAVYDEHIKGQLDILEKQLELERLKNSYFIGLAYDLRTAINSVSGGVELALKYCDDSDKVKDYLSKIVPAITEMIGMVEDNTFNREVGVYGGEGNNYSREIVGYNKVLLVDDNELNREIVKALLEDSGIMVEVAENGEKAVGAVASSKPLEFDFILMDLQMPIMDGFEAAVKIRALNDSIKSNIPIIAMTASVTVEDKAKAKASGMDYFIAKPVDIKKLIQIMGDLEIVNKMNKEVG